MTTKERAELIAEKLIARSVAESGDKEKVSRWNNGERAQEEAIAIVTASLAEKINAS